MAAKEYCECCRTPLEEWEWSGRGYCEACEELCSELGELALDWIIDRATSDDPVGWTPTNENIKWHLLGASWDITGDNKPSKASETHSNEPAAKPRVVRYSKPKPLQGPTLEF